MPESWEIRSFSLNLPEGRDRSDIPALLRHLADQLEEYGPIEVQDVTFGTEITGEGSEYHFTVYFHPKEDVESE
jgi:hypothetical protein